MGYMILFVGNVQNRLSTEKKKKIHRLKVESYVLLCEYL